MYQILVSPLVFPLELYFHLKSTVVGMGRESKRLVGLLLMLYHSGINIIDDDDDGDNNNSKQQDSMDVY